MKYPRNVRMFRGQLDASPFVGVLFLVVIFLLLSSSLVFTPGVPIELPEGPEMPGAMNPILTVAVDRGGRLYVQNQVVRREDFQGRLEKLVQESPDPPTLVLLADRSVPNETLIELVTAGHAAGAKGTVLATRPPDSTGQAGQNP